MRLIGLIIKHLQCKVKVHSEYIYSFFFVFLNMFP